MRLILDLPDDATPGLVYTAAIVALHADRRELPDDHDSTQVTKNGRFRIQLVERVQLPDGVWVTHLPE